MIKYNVFKDYDMNLGFKHDVIRVYNQFTLILLNSLS